jgi:hypothetical protein
VPRPPKPEFSRLNTHNGATHRSKCPARTAAPMGGAGQCTGCRVHLGHCRATSCHCRRKPGGAHMLVLSILAHAGPMRCGMYCKRRPRCRRGTPPRATPEEPKQRNGPLGAPKRRPDPAQPDPTRPAPARVRRSETTALGPTGAHLGGLPGGGACPGRRRRRPKPQA